MLSLGAQISGLLFSFSLFYTYNMKNTLPNSIEVKKFRNKKLSINSNKTNEVSNSIKTEFDKDLLIYANTYK